MKGISRSAAALVLAGVIVALSLGAQSIGARGDDLSVYEDPARLLELIENTPADFYLVDTRTREEYLSGHIPGAIHRDYREIGEDLPTDDRDALIVVYCLSGVRSNRAARTLRGEGFERVLDWGGIVDWPYAVVTGPDPHER